MERIEAYDFGKLLQQLRKQKKLSQQQLGAKLGLESRGSVGAWEQGIQRPNSIDRVVALTEALVLSDDQSEKLFAAYFAPIFEAPSVYHQTVRHDCYPNVRLPVNYIRRTDVLSELRKALIGEVSSTEQREMISPQPIALHGMGGSGKSVMARALCEDPLIRAAFPDGILSVSLGKEPRFLAGMRTWINCLGGTISENAPTRENLQMLLMNLLRDRQCLLILDDVWKHTDAKQFLVGGKHCQVLLTTRDLAIADELGALTQTLPLMTPPEATRLLEAWAGEKLADTDPALKEQIVKRLGYLPLAIKLAGAHLRRKAPAEWLRDFHIHKMRSRRPETIHDDLVLTFELSLEDLGDETRRLYTALAVFREDEMTVQAAIERLWQGLGALNAEATTDLLNDLAEQALLEFFPYKTHRVVSLHILLRDFIYLQLGDDGLKETRQALLNGYRALLGDATWDALEDDGYIYDHLVYHLQAIDAIHELKSLFASSDWLYMRVSQSDYSYDGYLEDLMCVWNSAEAEALQQIEAQEEPTSIADCIRYLLINSTIESLDYLDIADLVMSAVKAGLWPLQRALTVAERLAYVLRKIQLCVELLEITSLSKKQREDVERFGLKVILENKHVREEAVATLAPWLSKETLEEGLSAILTQAQNEGAEQTELEELASEIPSLVKQLREQRLGAALETGLQRESAQDMDTQVSQLSEGYILWELARRVATSDEVQRTVVLSELEPHLTGVTRDIVQDAKDYLPEDIEILYQFRSANTQLSAEQRTQISNQGLEAILRMPNYRLDRTRALTVFLPLVPDQHELLKIIRRSITKELRKLKRWSRFDLFLDYFSKELFAPPIFSSETLNIIALNIIEIGEEWDWL